MTFLNAQGSVICMFRYSDGVLDTFGETPILRTYSDPAKVQGDAFSRRHSAAPGPAAPAAFPELLDAGEALRDAPAVGRWAHVSALCIDCV